MELIKKISSFEYPCISGRRYEWSDCGLKRHSTWGVLIYYSAPSRTKSPDNRNQESSTKLYVPHNNITECVFMRRLCSGRALKNKNESVKHFSAKKLIPNRLNYINTTNNHQTSSVIHVHHERAGLTLKAAALSCLVSGIGNMFHTKKRLHVHGGEVRISSISRYHSDKSVSISSQTRNCFSLRGKNCWVFFFSAAAEHSGAK